jgi:ring-1,2-phenylacetyl-CoA epoxidase subunit PaaC
MSLATTSIAVDETPLVLHLLRRADDALILGHRLSEWTGNAPTLEEDLALANIALDLIGQARALYDHAGSYCGLDEDQLAYRRDARQYRNLLLVEQPNGDFGCTIARQVLYAAFIDPWWRAAMSSSDATIAAIAAKAEKETAYHLRHAAEWLIRLGDGTEESRRRAQAGLDELWPFTGEFFEVDAPDQALIDAGVIPDPAELHDGWSARIDTILSRATLARPADSWMQTGGRSGRHGEHLGHILAELQYLQRSHPGARW